MADRTFPDFRSSRYEWYVVQKVDRRIWRILRNGRLGMYGGIRQPCDSSNPLLAVSSPSLYFDRFLYFCARYSSST